MTILTLPASPSFQTATFGLRSATQVFASPLSGAIQTLEMPGAVWTLDAALPPIQSAAWAAAWRVFFAQCRGQAGRFYAGDPKGKTPRGIATGTPLVAGGSQTGASLATDGWTAGVTGILLAGDYIAFSGGSGRREMHLVTADANSDGSGAATLSIEPPIRSSPADNAAIITSSPTCIMMLKDPAVTWDEAEASIYGFALSAVEALYG